MAWLLLYNTILALERTMQFGAAQTPTLRPSPSPPNGASLVVDPSFAGFGIEPSNLFSFTGHDSPNKLTENLLYNLASYTGYPANIRIGGNTQDYMVYSDDQTEWAWVNSPDKSGTGEFTPNHMLIGPHFYDAIDRLPQGTPVTYGLNMAYHADDYAEVLSTLMQQAIQRLKNVHLVSFELGNEPDLWLQNGFRTGLWNSQIYAQQWLDRAGMLCDQILLPNKMPCNVFEPGTTASTIGTDFQIQDLVSLGIDKCPSKLSTSYVAQWNQHDYYYFLGISTYPLTTSRFMNLSTTRDQFRAWEEQISQAEVTAYRYALREMGMVGPVGLEGITNTFGAALWTLNFFLYAACLNITNVGMHMTDNSNSSAWQPVEMYDRSPHVRPLYYAFAAFDQIVGPSCQAQVVDLSIGPLSDDYVDHVEAYTIYQDSMLSSIVVINARIVNESEPYQPHLAIEVDLPAEFANQQLHLAYLAGAGADSTSNITWNGISFEQNGDGKPSDIADNGHTVTISNEGKVKMAIRDSQAVVAQISTPVGKIQLNKEACKQLKGSDAGQSDRTSTASASSLDGRPDANGPSSITSANRCICTGLYIVPLSALLNGLFFNM